MMTTVHATCPSEPCQADDVLAAMDAFFRQTAPAAHTAPLSADLRLLESGLLDSLSMLQLTTHLSDTFDITFEDDDFTAENFATAGRVAALVTAKVAERT
jgi:acyl carrier protein